MTKTRALPARLRIAGSDYAVVIAAVPEGITAENRGMFDDAKLRITIDASSPLHLQRRTLLHEIIHAAGDLYGTAELTEDHVRALETGLWAIFNDNPGLARTLFGPNV
ncbi:hypothetical protein [Caldimonas sp. KR1-144]|uniref:hypothetical protein n=1 Tax=Caldimonas sp. KR1-144 TaxID=3400911 RepID=UPI003C0BA46B